MKPTCIQKHEYTKHEKFLRRNFFQNITPYLDHRNFCKLEELGKHTLQRARLRQGIPQFGLWMNVCVHSPHCMRRIVHYNHGKPMELPIKCHSTQHCWACIIDMQSARDIPGVTICWFQSVHVPYEFVLMPWLKPKLKIYNKKCITSLEGGPTFQFHHHPITY